MIRAAIAIAALSACGDNVLGGYQLGARLLPVGFVYEDGTTQPRSDRFFDLARDEDCTV